MKFQIEQVLPDVYHLRIPDPYDLAMSFLRYQEFAESPKFAGQRFTLLEHMEWYAKTQSPTRCFSYPADWIGFNIPSDVFDDLDLAAIADANGYDDFMHAVAALLDQTSPAGWYLIGTSEGNADVLEHELSHGLFAVDPEYRERAGAELAILAGTRPEILAPLQAWIRLHYHERVVIDESIAYLATGYPSTVEPPFDLDTARAPFVALFQERLAARRAVAKE